MYPPGQIHPLDMAQNKWLWILGQFTTIALLMCAVWYFERRQSALEQSLTNCQNEKMDRLLTAINANTAALDRLNTAKNEKE